MPVKEEIEVIDVQGLVPVFVDVVCPVEFSLNDPAALLPAHDGRFAWNHVVFKQAAIEAVALIISNQVGIRKSAGSATSEDSGFRKNRLPGGVFFRTVFEIAAIELAAL